jgi:hypothetical protein
MGFGTEQQLLLALGFVVLGPEAYAGNVKTRGLEKTALRDSRKRSVCRQHLRTGQVHQNEFLSEKYAPKFLIDKALS